MIKLSFIVPIYNSEKYLEKCINSMINQTLKDIEIILINDGSTDNSENVIKSFNDKRITYIKKKNEGIGKTRNLGIKLAKGKYISFLDSDDYLENNFAEVLYNKAEQCSCDIVICDYFVDDKEIKKEKCISFNDTNLKKYPKLLTDIELGPCNKIYKNNLFINKNNRFIENLKYEDAPFVVRMILAAKKIGKVDLPLTHYVIHNFSETTTRDEKIFDILKIVDIINNDLNDINFPKDEQTNLSVKILTNYTIQQRYVVDHKMRNLFINKVFSYLNNLNPAWKKCDFLRHLPFYKRIIKSNKFLTKVYCNLYQLLKRRTR